jgi:ATP-dependent RNA helicase HelY
VLNLWDAPAGERVLTVMRASLLNFQQSRRLRDLEQELEEEEARLAEVPAGCLIGYDNGEELLDEYEHRGREVEELRRRERKADQNVRYIESRRDELPWRRPERDQLRKAFRNLPQGGLVHLEQQGWSVYLGRGLGGAVIGLFLGVGQGEAGVHLGEIFPLTEYRQIDYLHTVTVTVDLPYALTTLAVPPTVPLEELLSPDELEQLRRGVAEGLQAVPDLEAWIAEYRTGQMEHIEEASAKARANLEEVRAELTVAARAEREHVCHDCPVRKEHRSNRRLRARLLLDRDTAEKRLTERRHFEETRLQTTLKGLTSVLVQFAYLRKGELTFKARKLADIFDTNTLMVTEMVEGGYLDGLKPQDLAEVFSWFAYDRDIDFLNRLLLPRYLLNLRRDLDSLQNAIFAAERRQDLALTRGYNPYFYGAARAWCKGTSIADLLDQMQMSEGDLVMTFNKTLDLMRQVRDMLAHQDPDNPLRAVLSDADKLMRRGVVEMSQMIGFAPRSDTEPAAPDSDDLDDVGE